MQTLQKSDQALPPGQPPCTSVADTDHLGRRPVSASPAAATSPQAQRLAAARPDLPSERGDKPPAGHTGLKPRYRRGGVPPWRSRDESLSFPLPGSCTRLSLPLSPFFHLQSHQLRGSQPRSSGYGSLSESSAFASPFTGCRDDPRPPRRPG